MINKKMFKYYDVLSAWVYLSYSLTKQQYDTVNYKLLSNLINFSESNFQNLEDLSQKAILNYATEIDFFSKEEYGDLLFEYLDTIFDIENKEIISFTRCYSINEENAKIFWKDIYGIWKVSFKEKKVIKVVRENS